MSKGILALLAPDKGKGDDAEGYDDSASEETDEVDAARDVLDAIKDNDPKALSMALSRHYELCAGEK